MYLAPVIRTLTLAALVLLVAAGPAAAATQEFRIVLVSGLGLDDLQGLADRGAVGLLVPANGPTTSGEQARAALVRGELRNALLDDGVPSGPPLVSFETAAEPPRGRPAIVLGLPSGSEQSNDRRYPIAIPPSACSHSTGSSTRRRTRGSPRACSPPGWPLPSRSSSRAPPSSLTGRRSPRTSLSVQRRRPRPGSFFS